MHILYNSKQTSALCAQKKGYISGKTVNKQIYSEKRLIK